MAKNTFLDWDPTASNNTDIAGIGILGTNAVRNFDDAFRTLMAQLRAGVDGEVVYAVKAGNYTALANDNNAVHRYTATATVSLTAAATLGANWHYIVIADGADVTIDPNGAETIDGAATLVIPNGQTEYIICNGSAFFTKRISSLLPKLQPYGTIASAATTDLGTITSQNVTVTGTTTITSLGTVAAGTFRRLVFSGILTLTHNATSLILPNGGSNIVTAAGDSLEAVSLGSGNWRVTSYERATPSATRAWVSFSGASGTISASDNVSSVTRNGVGDYTINFTVAMQDANYVTFGSVHGTTSANVDTVNVNNTGGQTTTSVRIIAVRATTGAFDPTRVSVLVVR